MQAKFIFSLFLIGIIFLGWLGFQRFRPNLPSESSGLSKINVTATFYPLVEFTKQVGGETVIVTNLTRPGSEPHDFEPSPQDLVQLNNSDLLIFNGANFEPWITQVSTSLSPNVKIVDSSSDISLLMVNGTTDPHIWLDPVRASQQVDTITNSLITVNPDRAQLYTQNATGYKQQLADLDRDFRESLANCQLNQIVTSHDAFQYLAERYGLEVMSVSGLSPDEEPSPQAMAEIVQFVRQTGISYIFFESLVSPKLSETIALETGAQTIVFNPLEGLSTEELQQGKNYLSVQQENLRALKTALVCQ